MYACQRPLLTAVVAAILWSVGTATAGAQVEVIDEATLLHCDPTCSMHTTGEVKISGHAFGVESTVSDCVAELNGAINGTGEGQYDSVALADHAGSTECTVTQCGALPWVFHVQEPAASVETLDIEVCVDDGDTRRRCGFSLPIATGANHEYESVFQAPDVQGTNHENLANCELEGQLHLEGTGIELVH